MARPFGLIMMFLVFGVLIPSSGAQEKGKVEKIPAPKQKVEPGYPVFPRAPREDTLQVWQHYGVGPLGRFVPRVIVTPYGPLYSRDLQPYPWIHNRTSSIMPYAVD